MTSHYTKNNTNNNDKAELIYTGTTYALITLAAMGIAVLTVNFAPSIALWLETASALTQADIERH